MRRQLKNWMQIGCLVLRRFFSENYTYRASALAFTTLLALVPLLSVFVSFLALFPIFTKLVNLAQEYILTNFVPTSSATVQYYLVSFTQQASHLPIVGILFLFFTAIMLVVTVEHSLNEIWGVPNRRKRVTALILYWLVLLVVPLFIGLDVLISTYLFSIAWVRDATVGLGIKAGVLSLIPLLINTMLFTLLYVVVPNARVFWRDGLFGGFIAACLFEVAKRVFSFYIKQFPSYELIYGTFATIPIFLLWIYVSWMIILFGALFTHTQFTHRHLFKKKSSKKIR